MKRILFNLIIVIQFFVIIFLTYQFEGIENTGEEIKIQTISPDFPVYGDFIHADMYVEYDINIIAEDKWDNSLPLDYNEPVYILLQEDKTGVFRVRKASTDKININKDNEIVLRGTYHYHDTERDIHYVNYGLEYIKHADQFGTFKPTDQLVVTVLLGKWGQHKFVAIEKWNE